MATISFTMLQIEKLLLKRGQQSCKLKTGLAIIKANF